MDILEKLQHVMQKLFMQSSINILMVLICILCATNHSSSLDTFDNVLVLKRVDTPDFLFWPASASLKIAHCKVLYRNLKTVCIILNPFKSILLYSFCEMSDFLLLLCMVMYCILLERRFTLITIVQ